MKSLLLVPMVITAISLINIANAATNGTVNFSGKLNDQTCQVVLNDSTSASGSIKLPTIPKDELAAKYNTAGSTPFTLKLTGCKASSTTFGVLAYFPPTGYTDNTSSNFGVLKNLETGTTAAEGVYLAIYGKYGATEKMINVGNAITDPNYQYTTVDAGASSVTLQYNVKYIRYGFEGFRAGKVKGIAVYELAYQ